MELVLQFTPPSDAKFSASKDIKKSLLLQSGCHVYLQDPNFSLNLELVK